uniref:Kazal-like domain-containing protein n=1 Tax=Erpetoichthys calabaricus TaxID=27687 RepID=A0A8C4TD10_ERPCA
WPLCPPAQLFLCFLNVISRRECRYIRCDILNNPVCGNDGRTYGNICTFCSLKRFIFTCNIHTSIFKLIYLDKWEGVQYKIMC